MEEYNPLILVADDEPDTVELVRLYLARDGYRFTQAYDGGQALKLAQEELPDLILLDINMPVLDGFSVLERLRQDPATATVVVIIMTAAYGRRQDRLRGFALGADDYITKPLDRRELAARVRSRLRVKWLERDLRRQREELENLYRVAQEIAITLNPSELANRLLTVAGRAIGAEDGWVILVSEGGDPLHAVRYGDTLPPQASRQLAIQSLREGIGGVVSRTQTGLLITDAAHDERYSTGELGLSGIRSVVSVPLVGRRHSRGVLTYAHSQPGRFTKKHLQWLRSAAGQAAVALDNAHMFAREQRRAVQFRLLNSVTQDLSSVLEEEQLLEVATTLIQRTYGYYYVGMGLKQAGDVVIQAVAQDEGGADRSALLGPVQVDGLVSQVAQDGRPLLVKDVRKDSRYRERPGLTETRSELALPIRGQDGVIGVLDIRSRKVNAFDPDDVTMLETLASQVSIIIQNARLFWALSNERERLNAVLNSVDNVVLVTDQEGRFLLVNPAARRLLQLTGDGTGISADSGLIPDVLRVYFSQPILAGDTLVGEYRNDAGQSFQVVAAPVAVDGATTGRVVLLHEVTHSEELGRLKEEFVASVSHDLESPLKEIEAASDSLAREDATEDERSEAISNIQESVRWMNALVTQLLDLGRLDSGMGLEQAEIDAAPLLQEVAEEFEEEVARSGLTLNLDAPSRLPVWADAERLRQALGKLLSNAVRYTPRGGTIMLEAVDKDTEIQFKVQDTGPGIPEGDQPHVFDRFYRGQPSAGLPAVGTGLGLAIAKSIVEGHDGRIWLESKPGEGSTFFIALPRAGVKAGSELV